MAGLLSAAAVSLRTGSRALMRINTRAATHQQVREGACVCLYYISHSNDHLFVCEWAGITVSGMYDQVFDLGSLQ